MVIKVLIIAGTRPEYIKLSPLLRQIQKDEHISLTFIHSGQHYDKNLYTNLIEDLNLPNPDFDIEVGSGTHGYQTGTLIQRIEKYLLEIKPDLVISQGDTNTVLASALATRKLNKCFMHLEAGIRSFDKRMPEEINRVLTGVCAMYHLAPTERAAINLLFEGIDRKSIFIVGNTIVDAVLETKELAESKSRILERLGINKNESIVLITLHRPANVDNKEKFEKFIKTLIELKEFTFLFPIHPRTMKNLKKFNLTEDLENNNHIILTEPLGYLDFSKIFSNSLCVLTDSGGIQEEASILRIPCITLRNNTERPETLEYNSNILVGMNMEKLKSELMKINSNPQYLKGKSSKNPFGDGKSAKKIVEIIKDLYSKNLLKPNYSKLWTDIPKKALQDIEIQESMSVLDYETKCKLRIQLIFDKNGIPKFPYDDTILKKGERLLVNLNNKIEVDID